MFSADVCPFDDPEFLSQIADQAGSAFTEQRKQLLNDITPTLNEDQLRILTELDNLAIAEINAVQEATINKVICEPCKRQGQPCRSPHKNS